MSNDPEREALIAAIKADPVLDANANTERVCALFLRVWRAARSLPPVPDKGEGTTVAMPIKATPQITSAMLLAMDDGKHVEEVYEAALAAESQNVLAGAYEFASKLKPPAERPDAGPWRAADGQDLRRALVDLLRAYGVKPNYAIDFAKELADNGWALVEVAASGQTVCVPAGGDERMREHDDCEMAEFRHRERELAARAPKVNGVELRALRAAVEKGYTACAATVLDLIDRAIAETRGVGTTPLIDLIRQRVAQGWCTPENAHKEMDAVLAEAIVNRVYAAVACLPCDDCDAREEAARSTDEVVGELERRLDETKMLPHRNSVERTVRNVALLMLCTDAIAALKGAKP